MTKIPDDTRSVSRQLLEDVEAMVGKMDRHYEKFGNDKWMTKAIKWCKDTLDFAERIGCH